ncbi:hypothetical protein [Kitasatospora cineracea]|uniref:ABC-2 family transporter n=1 Tax=Kitasatospora cineracea TaxID=88074 RepID=A0A3N4R2Q8_9ACTN|nr:hypothetical protein [Kitasatospora cineracea]RPE27843.1 hypothetical protein EDD38_7133 [Kitasatospora cineracea]
MSTDVLTGPAKPAAAPGRPSARAPRLRGLLWLSLRQNRVVLRVLAVLLVLVSADLVWMHASLEHTVGVLRRTGCYSPETWDSDTCWILLAPVNRPHFWYLSVLQPLATALPLLLGVFVGAPLLAQEYERGTIRLVRTQSVSPARWLAARLAVPGVAVLVASGVFACLMTWVWWTDIVHGPDAFDPPFHAFTYPALGVAPVAWSLFALALGVLVGQLCRRVVPAMFLTGALVAALGGLAFRARSDFWPAVEATGPVGTYQPTNAWLVDRMLVLADGSRVRTSACLGSDSCASADTVWMRYHPAGHLVPVQLVEAGGLLLLTVAVLAVVFRRLRRS